MIKSHIKTLSTKVFCFLTTTHECRDRVIRSKIRNNNNRHNITCGYPILLVLWAIPFKSAGTR